jgi:hypothetical protein
MSKTGRYTVVDLNSGRRFVVEPLHERNEKATDTTMTNGGVDGASVKNKSQVQGGSVSEDESIITPENGFMDIRYALAGVSPMDIIAQMLENPKLVIEENDDR